MKYPRYFVPLYNPANTDTLYFRIDKGGEIILVWRNGESAVVGWSEQDFVISASNPTHLDSSDGRREFQHREVLFSEVANLFDLRFNFVEYPVEEFVLLCPHSIL